MKTIPSDHSRPVGWRSALRELASELDGQPFEWGRTDCASIARRSIELISGTDSFPDLEYEDELGARRELRRLGTFEAALEKAGCRLVSRGFEQVGDILLSQVGDDFEDVGFTVLVAGGGLTVNPADGVMWRGISGPVYREYLTAWRPAAGSKSGLANG